jgi:NAD(P)-dependent dehydrogenase (short-subunit alcohol dehydrogenase family)
MERISLVTGASRGLGLGVVRILAGRGETVVAGCRDTARGVEAIRGIQGDVHVMRLDVTDPSTIAETVDTIDRRWGRLDVLVNNAATHYDTWQSATSADPRTVSEALGTNVVGAWRTASAAIPLLQRSKSARIVNVSSEAGSLSSMSSFAPAYAVSKAALNALTRVLAAELRRDGILVNSVCPGWVATDMGGPGGRSIDAGVASILWAADLPNDGPTGGFFQDGRRLAW